jgi:hypothetical protein
MAFIRTLVNPHIINVCFSTPSQSPRFVVRVLSKAQRDTQKVPFRKRLGNVLFSNRVLLLILRLCPGNGFL